MLGWQPKQSLEIEYVELAQQERCQQRDDRDVISQPFRALPVKVRPLGRSEVYR
jgi:hypothetical protein